MQEQDAQSNRWILKYVARLGPMFRLGDDIIVVADNVDSLQVAVEKWSEGILEEDSPLILVRAKLCR